MERMLSAGFVEQYVVKAARGVPRNVLHTAHQAFKDHITCGSVGGVAEQALVFIMSVKVEIPIVQNVARRLVPEIEIGRSFRSRTYRQIPRVDRLGTAQYRNTKSYVYNFFPHNPLVFWFSSGSS